MFLIIHNNRFSIVTCTQHQYKVDTETVWRWRCDHCCTVWRPLWLSWGRPSVRTHQGIFLSPVSSVPPCWSHSGPVTGSCEPSSLWPCLQSRIKWHIAETLWSVPISKAPGGMSPVWVCLPILPVACLARGPKTLSNLPTTTTPCTVYLLTTPHFSPTHVFWFRRHDPTFFFLLA